MMKRMSRKPSIAFNFFAWCFKNRDPICTINRIVSLRLLKKSMKFTLLLSLCFAAVAVTTATDTVKDTLVAKTAEAGKAEVKIDAKSDITPASSTNLFHDNDSRRDCPIGDRRY